MKKSDAKKLIEAVLSDVSEDPADDILNALVEAGMLPPKRDYIEHYAFKCDNSWEKE